MTITMRMTVAITTVTIKTIITTTFTKMMTTAVIIIILTDGRDENLT
jgi:hypothetical protein